MSRLRTYLGAPTQIGGHTGSIYSEPAGRTIIGGWPIGDDHFNLLYSIEDIHGLTDYPSFWVRALDASDPEALSASSAIRVYSAGPGKGLSGQWGDPVDGHTWLVIGNDNGSDSSYGRGRLTTYTLVGGSTPVLGTSQILDKGMPGNPSGPGTATGSPGWSQSVAVCLSPTTGILIPNGQVQPLPPGGSSSDPDVGSAGVYAYPLTFTQAAFTIGTAVAFSGGPQHVTAAVPIDSTRVLLLMTEYSAFGDGRINAPVAQWATVMDSSCSVGNRLDASSWSSARVLADGRILVWGGGTGSTALAWSYLTVSGTTLAVDTSGTSPWAPTTSPAPISLGPATPVSSFAVWDDEVWTSAWPAAGEFRGLNATWRLTRGVDGSLADAGDVFSSHRPFGLGHYGNALGGVFTYELADAPSILYAGDTSATVVLQRRALVGDAFSSDVQVIAPFIDISLPIARLSAVPASGRSPLTVALDGSTSEPGDVLVPLASWALDFGDAGSTSGIGTPPSPTAIHIYTAVAGLDQTYTATLVVTDVAGFSSSATVPATVLIIVVAGVPWLRWKQRDDVERVYFPSGTRGGIPTSGQKSQRQGLHGTYW